MPAGREGLRRILRAEAASRFGSYRINGTSAFDPGPIPLRAARQIRVQAVLTFSFCFVSWGPAFNRAISVKTDQSHSPQP